MKPHIFQNTLKALSTFLVVPLIVVVSGFLFSGCGPSDENVDTANDLIAEAVSLADSYRYADAMKKYESASDKDEGNVDIYTGIADIYLVKNRTSDAKEVLEVGLKKSREPSKAYLYLGKMALEVGAVDDAIARLKQAVSKDGENYEAQYMLALAYVNDGDFTDARRNLDIPEEGGDWFARARLLEAVLFGDDIEQASEAIGETDGFEVVDDALADALGVYEDVLDEVDILMDEDADDSHIDVVLSYGALTAGYEDVVIDRLEKYVSDDEEDLYWDLLLYLGRAYSMDGEIDKAEEYLSASVSLNPSDPYGPWYLGRVYTEKGMDTDAVDMYERAIALSEEETVDVIREEYVEILVNMGQYAESDEQLRLLAQGAEDAETANRYQLMRVESLVEREQYADADAVLGDIMVARLTEEQSAEYSWAQAMIHFNNGRRDAALESIDDAIEANDSESKYHLLKGQVEFEIGLVEDARISLERAVDLDLRGDVSAEAAKVLDRI